MDQNVITMIKAKGPETKKFVKWIIAVIVLFFIILLLNPFVIVGAGERGVMLTFGAVQKTVFGEGLHLRIPVVQKIIAGSTIDGKTT